MKPIGSIDWPSDSHEAISVYLQFLILVIRKLGITFSGDDLGPIQTAESYLAQSISEAEYSDAANSWWLKLEKRNMEREFQDPIALEHRLAISLLSAKPSERDDLGEHLSWFFETLENLGFDLDQPINLMQEHFDFK